MLCSIYAFYYLHCKSKNDKYMCLIFFVLLNKNTIISNHSLNLSHSIQIISLSSDSNQHYGVDLNICKTRGCVRYIVKK